VSERGYNINSLARNQRMRIGVILYSLGFLSAVALVESSLPAAWRALVFIPFVFGGVFVFQAAYGVCPMRAFRGERETARGIERVANPKQQKLDRRGALTVFSTAACCALLATSVLFLLP
jgi:hypothetical protein